MEDKKILRKKIREQKKLYSFEKKRQLSLPIFEKIEGLNIFPKADVVLCYWSMEDEVYTWDFVNKWYQEKTILLPCVEGDDLILRQYLGQNSMRAGEQFGILEPVGKEYATLEDIKMMIVPGVAFDSKKNRMGRGRGFYDRLLSTIRAVKIGVCFDFQIVENVPMESFDIKMDKVISSSYLFE